MLTSIGYARRRLSLFLLFTMLAGSLGIAPPQQANAAMNYSASWMGDTFDGATKWTQNFIWSMAVNGSGRVFTMSHWDESHREAGIYENGDVIGKMNNYGDDPSGDSVAVNGTHAFGSRDNGARRYDFNGQQVGPIYDVGVSPTALAANASILVATLNGSDEIKVFDVNSGSLLRSWSVTDPGAVAVKSNGDIYVVSKVTRMQYDDRFWKRSTSSAPVIERYSSNGSHLGTIGALYSTWLPTALAIDNQGRLMVGDNGPRRQIHFYSTSNAYANSFGDLNGIASGTPGEVTPTKFWGITGVGTDSSGNIYVSISEHGSLIRALSPDGTLLWEVQGLNFVDVNAVDPGSDGLDVYGKNEHYIMDYSKPQGQEATFTGYTMDSIKYPQDPRMWMPSKDHHYTSPFMRRLNGNQLYMYGTGMYSYGMPIHRFEGEIAVPSGMFSNSRWESAAAPNWPPNQPATGAWIWRDADGQGDFDANEYESLGSDIQGTWGWYPDSNGDVWMTAVGKIIRFPLQGHDTHGNPIYTFSSRIEYNLPAPFNLAHRVIYFPDINNGTLYLVGYTDDKPYDDSRWSEAGKVLARYDNWNSGNRTPSMTMDTPWDLSADPNVVTQSVDVAGDYIFIAGTDTRAKV